MKIKLLLIFTVCTLVLFTQCKKESTFVEVSTSEISEITKNSLSCGGVISNVGNVPITERGICWGTSPDLTLSNNKIVDTTKKSTYKISITGLYANTEYYIRAYAIYSNDTCYGDVKSSKTLDYTYGTVTDIDGNEYTTITIGEQEWMMENLKVSKYNDNTVIPNLTDSTEWRNSWEKGAVCDYENNPLYSETHGKLYNCFAGTTGKLCPAGWHVPADEEWESVIEYFGADTIAYKKLSEVGFYNNKAGGYRRAYSFTEYKEWITNVDFSELKNGNVFWTTTHQGGLVQYCRAVSNGSLYSFRSSEGHSVRCVKD